MREKVRPQSGRVVPKDSRGSEVEGFDADLADAQATLKRAEEVQAAFHQRGDLGFWFAELYRIITEAEIRNRHGFKSPGFVMTFIPIFYEMYAKNAEAYVNGDDGGVNSRWRTHFIYGKNWNEQVSGSERTPRLGELGYTVNSLVSGVRVHITEDMAEALCRAYRSYSQKHNTKAPFDAYKEDFFNAFSKSIFRDQVRTQLLRELISFHTMSNDGDPAFMGRVSEQLGVGLDVATIWRWREDAWKRANEQLKKEDLGNSR
jgi:hypothetical protein